MVQPAHPFPLRERFCRGIASAGLRLPVRARALALAVGAFLTVLGSPAQGAGTPTTIEYQFLRPEAPGDRFALRFTVPAGHVPAVLITNRTAGEPTDDEATESTSTTLLPLPLDPSGTYTGIDGVLPQGVTPEQLANSIVALRLVFFHPPTETFLLSPDLPLIAEAPPEAELEITDDGGDSDEDALSAHDMKPSKGGSASLGGDQETQSASEDAGTGSSSFNPKSGSYSVGWNVISSTPLAILALSSLSSAAFLSIYDQPTPVQGSGH